jgi:hypothetical protein
VIRRTVSGVALALLLVSCGSVVDVPSRDLDTEPYLDVVFRIPSFWVDEAAPGETTVFYYVRDDSIPAGVDREAVREIVAAAAETWHEPLREAHRNVDLRVLFATEGPPPGGPRVEVAFVWRGQSWLGRTIYLADHVRVELSVRALSLERFLTRRELLALAVHELGHSLGISTGAPGTDETTGKPGHSPNPNDVMYGHNLDNTWVTLSNGDRQTIVSLFPR